MNAGDGAAEARLARWAKSDRFRMRYGAPALLTGWFVTFVMICVALTVTSVISDLMAGFNNGMGIGFLFVALIYGFPVAVVVGLPLAILVAWPLRRVRDQRLHVVAFAVALGVAMTGFLLLSGEGRMEVTAVPWILGAAACGAIGRASVIKLVTRRNRRIG